MTKEQLSMKQRLRDLEKQQILAALDICEGNVSEACKKIQMPRRTFYHRLSEFGIDPERFRK